MTPIAPKEVDPLLETQSLTYSDENTSVSNADSEEGPWPATFERSISILAGPVTDIDDIDRITRSPRFVPIQVANARVSANSFFLCRT